MAAAPGPRGAGRGRPRRPRRPRAQPALRRPAATRRGGPCAGDRPRAGTRRRAHRQPGHPVQRRRAGRPGPAEPRRPHHRAHHPRGGRRRPRPAGDPPRRRAHRVGSGGGVNLYETVRFAIRGVTANKLRSGLTVLGILIGVAAVILLVAVGNGSAKQIQANIERLGTNTLTITSGQVRGGITVQTQNTALTTSLVTALGDHEAAPDVKSVSPVITGSQTATYQGTDHTIPQCVGTIPAYLT